MTFSIFFSDFSNFCADCQILFFDIFDWKRWSIDFRVSVHQIFISLLRYDSLGLKHVQILHFCVFSGWPAYQFVSENLTFFSLLDSGIDSVTCAERFRQIIGWLIGVHVIDRIFFYLVLKLNLIKPSLTTELNSIFAFWFSRFGFGGTVQTTIIWHG